MNKTKYNELIRLARKGTLLEVKQAVTELANSLPDNTKAVILKKTDGFNASQQSEYKGERFDGTIFSGISIKGCITNSFVIGGQWTVLGVTPEPNFEPFFEAPTKTEEEIKAELTPISFETADEEDVHIEGANEQDNEPQPAKRGRKPKTND